MRDDHVNRYARHIMLPDVGGLGQTALMVATVRMPLREPEPQAELVAGAFLAAGGVGTLIVPGSTETQRAELSARGPDTHVVTEPDAAPRAHDLVLAPRPTWWPDADGDAVALAFWRGSIAAIAAMTSAFSG